MNAAFQFLFQEIIDGAVPLHATHAGESLCHDADAEVGFAGAVIGVVFMATIAVMASVETAFINDFKLFRCKSRSEFLLPSSFVCYCAWTFGPVLPI